MEVVATGLSVPRAFAGGKSESFAEDRMQQKMGSVPAPSAANRRSRRLADRLRKSLNLISAVQMAARERKEKEKG